MEVMWLTTGYPWEGDPVGSIFFQTQAQALARLGVSVAVLAPTPAVPWPLARLRARWGLYSASPLITMDGSVRVVRPRYLSIPGEPSWAFPDRWIAAAAWRSNRVPAVTRFGYGDYGRPLEADGTRVVDVVAERRGTSVDASGPD